MNRLLLFIVLLLLCTAEILRVYFIMPFPGSQQNDTVLFAYWLGSNINWIRLLALTLLVLSLISFFKNSRLWLRVLLLLLMGFYGVIFFFFNFRFQADKIFYQPVQRSFAAADRDATGRNKLVIGIIINGQAKAYPIQLLGYHHQVRDSIGNTPVMITYCTVCRTSRAFSPIVNGKIESFRLVGMDHFNSMFEDETTASWWQQATGAAIAGPLKGAALKELPSEQLTLDAWLRKYPNSLIMQPDTIFREHYQALADYDDGTIESTLEGRNFFSWKPKSWVIGVANQHASKAYDWNELVTKKIIQDSVETLPILLTLENDSTSFHVFDRRVNGAVLWFRTSNNNNQLIDQNTNSIWNVDGLCIKGTLKGKALITVQAYNEFWHSWQTFHKNAAKFME